MSERHGQSLMLKHTSPTSINLITTELGQGVPAGPVLKGPNVSVVLGHQNQIRRQLLYFSHLLSKSIASFGGTESTDTIVKYSGQFITDMIILCLLCHSTMFAAHGS